MPGAIDETLDEIVAELRQSGSVVVEAPPGAGKTSFILATVDRLPAEVRPGVIEGDLASSIDADTISGRGVAVVQIG